MYICLYACMYMYAPVFILVLFTSASCHNCTSFHHNQSINHWTLGYAVREWIFVCFVLPHCDITVLLVLGSPTFASWFNFRKCKKSIHCVYITLLWLCTHYSYTRFCPNSFQNVILHDMCPLTGSTSEMGSISQLIPQRELKIKLSSLGEWLCLCLKLTILILLGHVELAGSLRPCSILWPASDSKREALSMFCTWY